MTRGQPSLPCDLTRGQPFLPCDVTRRRVEAAAPDHPLAPCCQCWPLQGVGPPTPPAAGSLGLYQLLYIAVEVTADCAASRVSAAVSIQSIRHHATSQTKNATSPTTMIVQPYSYYRSLPVTAEHTPNLTPGPKRGLTPKSRALFVVSTIDIGARKYTLWN